MPYCENCGAEVSPSAKFCRNCGAAQTNLQDNPAANVPPTEVKPVPITQPPPIVQPAPQQSQIVTNVPPPPPPPSPQPVQTLVYTQTQPSYGERVLGAMVLRKPKSLGRSDNYTGLVTNQRMIFAQMTNEMVTQSVQAARDQAKAEGKGFWGQWGDQLKTSFTFAQRYFSMQPSAILAETPGNFAIDNNAISEIKLKEEHERGGVNVRQLEIEIHSSRGKYEFKMDENDNYINLLKQVYGQRVKIPFGTFTFHNVRIGL